MTATEVMDVVVPDIGDFEEVPVIEILVAAGDKVAVDDPLLTLESDKATMDVPAPFAGVVKELNAEVGDKVSQGTLLLRLEIAADGDGAPDAADDTKASAVTSEAAPVEAAAPESVATAIDAETSDADPSDGGPPEATDGTGPVYASPSVRRLARERGIDLTPVKGSGR
jgi:pyruvate dehydrogenase E2 component (dihydrolipoamide acetyltransferase)